MNQGNRPSNRRFLLLLIPLLIIGLAVGAFFAINNSSSQSNPAQASNANNGQLERGGQLSIVPATSTLIATGKVEPTFPPATSTVARPTIAPTRAATAGPTSTPPAPTSTPAATSTPAPTVALETPLADTTIVPRRIRIPTIGVDTFVERVGVTAEGTMDVPKNIWNTAWFGDGGYRPGMNGNAVIAGHLDAPGSKAVFWDLLQVKPGDKIILSGENNKEQIWVVYDTKVYPIDSAPLVNIFGPSNEPHLNLITCGGTFDRSTQNYNKRLIVYSRLAG